MHTPRDRPIKGGAERSLVTPPRRATDRSKAAPSSPPPLRTSVRVVYDPKTMYPTCTPPSAGVIQDPETMADPVVCCCCLWQAVGLLGNLGKSQKKYDQL